MTGQAIQHITLSGSARKIGQQHGEALRDNIVRAIDLYGYLFSLSGLNEEEAFRRADHFKRVIANFNPAYADEIEGIAEGANQDQRWIYALNARSELMSSVSSEFGECTAFYFNKTSILAQNWDWAEPIEGLIALVKIQRDEGPDILMMTEPGLIGKIGMNEAGLGLCFNFLATDKPTAGVPLHVTNRAILESGNLLEARDVIDRAGFGKSGNVLVGQENGQGFDVEFAGDRIIEPERQPDFFTHTNHFVDEHFLSADPELVTNSRTRKQRIDTLCTAANGQTLEEAKRLLNDTQTEPNPILRKYVPHPELGRGGTICSIIMDLPKREMHFRLGNDATKSFNIYTI